MTGPLHEAYLSFEMRFLLAAVSVRDVTVGIAVGFGRVQLLGCRLEFVGPKRLVNLINEDWVYYGTWSTLSNTDWYWMSGGDTTRFLDEEGF